MIALSDEQFQNNHQILLVRIEKAALSTGRTGKDVTLVAVSKKQPIAALLCAARNGIKTFGENYAEEVPPKQAELRDFVGIQWHMIGHIQSRKAKIVADSIDWTHSIDSLDLAMRLNRALQDRGRIMPVLLEMNVSSEESKGGWVASDSTHVESLRADLDALLSCANLQVRGLMTMPPLLDDPEAVRPYFQRLAALRDVLSAKYPAVDWSELSMGTSADFEVAIQEGATMVRIGQALFGPRPSR